MNDGPEGSESRDGRLFSGGRDHATDRPILQIGTLIASQVFRVIGCVLDQA
jgi:hypothetical protein